MNCQHPQFFSAKNIFEIIPLTPWQGGKGMAGGFPDNQR
jgi:hypothetical protein